jgi:transcription initiation factor TFIID subunit 2
LFDVFSAAIHSVSVASHPADFVHHDPLAQINISNPQDCHTYPELKRKIYSALAEGDEGELSIAIPKEVSLRQTGHANHSLLNGHLSEGKFRCSRIMYHTFIFYRISCYA